jgi:hypothetical protein
VIALGGVVLRGIDWCVFWASHPGDARAGYKKRILGGIDVRVGWLQQSLGSLEEDATLFFKFQSRMDAPPRFGMALEWSGGLLQESDLEDPALGEGISQVFLSGRYYPSRNPFRLQPWPGGTRVF